MSDIAIKVENLGKSYLVGHNAAQSEQYTALRDVIARSARNFVRKTRDMFSGRPIVQGDEVEEFWALKDINFEIKQGERVGIIGRNGAGKSTLLKILSRITEPTTGRVTIDGRVASLLEVGTGFHPELTGRENIYLNGAILGMSRVEVQRKFDEIVSFSEIEKFLDTPVKRFSSGMYVRLAFAVAAHLEPDILVVDEVLAVGDAQFQKKCINKMGKQQEQGRTVLFVSHNMGAIRDLCSRAIVLKSGREIFDGPSEAGINVYGEGLAGPEGLLEKYFSGPLSERIKIRELEINGGSAHATISPSKEIVFALRGECLQRVERIRFSVNIQKDGFRVCSLHDTMKTIPLPNGNFAVVIRVCPHQFRPGHYTVGIGAHDGGVYACGVEWLHANDVASFEVVSEWSELNDFGAVGVVNIRHYGERICG